MSWFVFWDSSLTPKAIMRTEIWRQCQFSEMRRCMNFLQSHSWSRPGFARQDIARLAHRHDSLTGKSEQNDRPAKSQKHAVDIDNTLCSFYKSGFEFYYNRRNRREHCQFLLSPGHQFYVFRELNYKTWAASSRLWNDHSTSTRADGLAGIWTRLDQSLDRRSRVSKLNIDLDLLR